MSVDIYTVIWTIISFLLLCVVLNYLFYKPITKFMDQRKEKIDKGLSEQKDAKEKLEAAQGRMNEKFREAADEASAIIRESKQKDRAAYDAQISEARELSSEKIRQAGIDIKNEEARQLGEINEQMPELVCNLAEKILGQSIPVSDNRELVNSHLSEKA